MTALYGVLGGLLLALIGWWVIRVERAIQKPKRTAGQVAETAAFTALSPKERENLTERVRNKFGVSGRVAKAAAEEIARVLPTLPRAR